MHCSYRRWFVAAARASSPLTIALLVVLLFVVGGCSRRDEAGFVPQVRSADRDEVLSSIGAAREKWAGARIASYWYVIRMECWCAFAFKDVLIEVVDGEVSGARVVGEDDPSTYDSAIRLMGRTIAERLEALEGGIDRASGEMGVYLIDFDPATGVPVSVVGDPSVTTFDDEFGYTIVDFTVIGE